MFYQESSQIAFAIRRSIFGFFTARRRLPSVLGWVGGQHQNNPEPLWEERRPLLQGRHQMSIWLGKGWERCEGPSPPHSNCFVLLPAEQTQQVPQPCLEPQATDLNGGPAHSGESQVRRPALLGTLSLLSRPPPLQGQQTQFPCFRKQQAPILSVEVAWEASLGLAPADVVGRGPRSRRGAVSSPTTV